MSKESSGEHDGRCSVDEGAGTRARDVGWGLVGDSAAVVRHNLSVVTLARSELGVVLVLVVDQFHDVLADRHGLAYDCPLYAFGARRGCERPVITPEVLGVESLNEVS